MSRDGDGASGTGDSNAGGSGSNGSEPENTMRKRVGSLRSRYRLYVQLNTNRLSLTGAISLAFFLVLLALGAYDALPLRASMQGSDPTDTVFQAYIGSLITGVTLVVTLNQLVLSAELGPLGNQRERMHGAMEFRREVEDVFGSASPPEPASFLQALIDASRENATELRETVSDSRNEEVTEELDQFIDALTNNADAVSDELEDAQFGRYQVVKASLDYNYSWKIYEARRLRDDYAEDLGEEAEEAFDDLIRVLEFFGPAREHIKTLFFEWELVGLSRKILYLAIPALAVAVAMLAYLDASSFPGSTLGIDNIVLLFSAAVTVASTPFFLLGAYILRLATIARRTLAIGPFILRESDRSTDIDWES